MLDLQYSKSVQKALQKLDKPLRSKALEAMERFVSGLTVDCKKLKGYDNRYRIRLNDYRIIFDVIILKNTVYVIKIAHRKEVYKNLPPE